MLRRTTKCIRGVKMGSKIHRQRPKYRQLQERAEMRRSDGDSRMLIAEIEVGGALLRFYEWAFSCALAAS